MCFGKTKTLKTLRNRCHYNSSQDLGFNVTDNCDYLEPEQLFTKGRNNSNLNVIQINCRGIKSKLDDLEELLFQTNEPDIVLLSETWLKDGEERFIDIKNYKYEGVVRKHKKGGGVGILINNKIKYRVRTDLNANSQDNSFEHFFIEVKGTRYNIIAGSIYRLPNTDIENFIENYTNSLSSIKKEKNKELILGLDHNLDLLKQASHRKTQDFIETTLDNSLLPTITKPTRINKSSATLIDNIIISQKLQAGYSSSILLSNLSDHLPCHVEIHEFYAIKSEATKIKKRKLNKENLEKISQEINNTDWESTLAPKNATDSFDTVHSKIMCIVDKFAPEREVIIRNKRNNKPWITRGIANSIRKSKALFKRALTDKTQEKKYKAYWKHLTKIKRAAKLNYYQQKCIEFKQNTKQLWQLINKINKKTNDKTSLIPKLKLDNLVYHSGKDVSNILAKHFSTVGKRYAEKIDKPQTLLKDYIEKIPKNDKSMYLIPVDETEIDRLIRDLPNKKSYGYDKINNCLLKELRPVITHPLTIVFNKSLAEGVFPNSMKHADTVPLFKSKNKTDCNNYRPISLLITMSKLLEKVMYNRTLQFLDKHQLLFISQYGFRKKHSCSDAIMELTSEILKNKENNLYTACVFLDLSKAFDTLKPEILLRKMSNYGIRGQANQWFSSYLNNRKLRVKCRTEKDPGLTYSSSYDVEYGTPQGSCLGPLLFLIFTNDLYKNLDHCNAILFADDTTVYKGHRNKNYLRWCIETDLMKITDWFKANKLTVNIDKTVFMSFGPKDDKLNNIEIGGMTIKHSRDTKFLGLWLDDRLNWNKHCSMLITKLKRNQALIRITKNLFSQNTLKLIYYAHIHSHINYGLGVWGGLASKDIVNRIQRIQMKCLKEITKNPATLKILNIDKLIRLEHAKLGYRIEHKQLPEKIMKIITTDSMNKSLKKTHKYNTRNKNNLYLPKIKNNQYRNSFLYQANKEIMLLPKIKYEKVSYTTFIKSMKLTFLDETT